MAKRLITHDALRTKGIALSKCQLWRLEKVEKFPKRVPISAGRYAYVEIEIDEFLEKKIAARDAAGKAA